jgi:multiple sugar transport system permease protein
MIRKHSLSSRLQAPILLAPAFILIGIIFIYPLILAWNISFYDVSTYGSGNLGNATLSNYKELFISDVFWKALLNTAVYAAGVTVLALVIGLIFSLLLQNLRSSRKFFRMLLGLPWVIPSAIAALVWKWIFEPQSGILNSILFSFGIESVNWLQNPLAAMIAIIVVGTWHEYPYFMITCSAGLNTIPNELYEAASIDGASNRQCFWHITLPALRPIIGVAVTLSSLMSFREYDIIAVLTGGGPASKTQTLSVMIYKNAFQYFKMGFAATIGTISFIISVILVIILLSKSVKEFY